MTQVGRPLSETARWGLLVAVSLLVAAPLVAGAEDTSCSACTCTGDRDGDGLVTVDEVLAAVGNLLEGCPPLLWQRGCGPPIPGAGDCPDSVNFCGTERVGEPCDEAHTQCCPPGSKCGGTHCNAPLVCATHPRLNCPISRRDYKRDIHYLAPADVENVRNQLLTFKLARYRYKGESPSAPEHLGFVIEDIEPSPAVDEHGDVVDLYGYLSMAVATVQAQSNDIAALKRDIDDLSRRLKELHAALPQRRGGRAPQATRSRAAIDAP